ncbi:Serine/arginine-rich splicing factor [Trichinella spiralis]|uniref:Serine/arginine-rich splicing factor n=1 Tax=Trichinella spiralis TaxID=6334 RepID=A0ABR3KB74_TRISP
MNNKFILTVHFVCFVGLKMSSRSRAPPPKIEGMTSLKIDNLSARTGPAELRRAFEKFGEIVVVTLKKQWLEWMVVA